eukprot:798967-Amphidinium_carterae.1
MAETEAARYCGGNPGYKTMHVLEPHPCWRKCPHIGDMTAKNKKLPSTRGYIHISFSTVWSLTPNIKNSYRNISKIINNINETMNTNTVVLLLRRCLNGWRYGSSLGGCCSEWRMRLLVPRSCGPTLATCATLGTSH